VFELLRILLTLSLWRLVLLAVALAACGTCVLAPLYRSVAGFYWWMRP
jgi:hypothetical protein